MSDTPKNDFSHLWNGLPIEERERLMPYQLQAHRLHIWQVKQKAVSAHKAHMKELNDWMKNIDQEIDRFRVAQEG